MALQEVAIPIAFSGGIETKADPKLVPTTKLLALENAVFTRSTSLAKRNGYDALAKTLDVGGEYVDPRALAARGDELVMFTPTDGYSYRPSSSTWSHIGAAQAITHREAPGTVTGTDQSMPDSASASGVVVDAWEDSRGGVWWAVRELDGGRVLRAAEQLDSGGQSPRVVRVSDRLHVYYSNAGGQIMVGVVNPGNYLDPLVPIVVTGDLSTTAPYYDAVSCGAGIVGTSACAVLAWNHGASGGYRLGYVDPSGVLATTPPATTYAGPSSGPIACAWIDGTNPYGGIVVGVVYTDALDHFADVIDATAQISLTGGGVLVSDSPDPVARIAATFTTDGTISGDQARLGVQTTVDLVTFVEIAPLGSDDRDHYIEIGSVLGVTQNAGPRAQLRGHGLVSRGFDDGVSTVTGEKVANGGPCVFVTHDVPFFPYAMALRWGDIATAPTFAQLARVLVGTSDGVPVRGHLATVEQDEDDDRVWRWPGLARELVEIDADARPVAGFTETGIRVVRLDFDDADAYQATDFGRDLVIAGACPMRYDGATLAELGFHCAPDGSITTVAAGAGLPPPGPPPVAGSMAAGTYLYFAAYEEVDAQGEVHLGPMSVGTLATLVTGDNRVTITGPMYRLTTKNRVRIGIYRTEEGDTDGQFPNAYRVSSLDPSATGYNGYVLNDPTTDTWSFTDGMSDATLLTKEAAYTNAGALSNDPVPFGGVVISGKGRLFFTSPEDGTIVRYTKQQRRGYGPETSDTLAVQIDPYGGDVTALAMLDDTVIAFKAGAIYAIDGPGPLDNPDAAPQVQFSPARLVTSDVGCSAPRSIAVTPIGVMFQTTRGIYLLGRNQAVNYIGAPVEAYNAQAIVAATTLPGRTQIVFLTDDTAGRTLLYDYFHGQWSTFTNHAGRDAVVAGGAYYYLRAIDVDGRVFKENRASYLDAGVEITLLIETAWIKLLQYAQGLQRIFHAHFLGRWISPHILRVRFAIDYQAGWLEPYDLDVNANNDPAVYGAGPYGAGPYGGDSDALYQRRIHVSLKCQAIRLQISDIASPPPLAASFELSELLLTGGVLRSAVKVASGRTS